jgi:hypothetical protein
MSVEPTTERELRQFRLMDQTLRSFIAGDGLLGTTLADLKGLLAALEETPDDWIRHFKEERNALEVEYAVALNHGDAEPDASVSDLREVAERMRAMVEERISTLG